MCVCMIMLVCCDFQADNTDEAATLLEQHESHQASGVGGETVMPV